MLTLSNLEHTSAPKVFKKGKALVKTHPLVKALLVQVAQVEQEENRKLRVFLLVALAGTVLFVIGLLTINHTSVTTFSQRQNLWDYMLGWPLAVSSGFLLLGFVFSTEGPPSVVKSRAYQQAEDEFIQKAKQELKEKHNALAIKEIPCGKVIEIKAYCVPQGAILETKFIGVGDNPVEAYISALQALNHS